MLTGRCYMLPMKSFTLGKVHIRHTGLMYQQGLSYEAKGNVPEECGETNEKHLVAKDVNRCADPTIIALHYFTLWHPCHSPKTLALEFPMLNLSSSLRPQVTLSKRALLSMAVVFYPCMNKTLCPLEKKSPFKCGWKEFLKLFSHVDRNAHKRLMLKKNTVLNLVLGIATAYFISNNFQESNWVSHYSYFLTSCVFLFNLLLHVL